MALSFIFDTSKGETPESVARKRALAAAIMGQAGPRTARNAGEGIGNALSSIGQGIQVNVLNRRADAASQAGQASAAADWNPFVPQQFPAAPTAPGGGSGMSATDGTAPAAPVDAPSYSALPQGTDWLSYANQGATRNQPLSEKLVSDLGSFLPEMGVTMKVFSGGQDATGPHRTGSHRHDHGNAADVFFYKDGRQLDWSNPQDQPIFADIVRRGKAAGITGFGAGDGYMQPGSMHIGFGNPAVWGAGGRGSNAPDWLRQAYNSPAGQAPAVAAVNALAQGQPTQVASLDQSVGLPQQAPIPQAAPPLPDPRTIQDMPVAEAPQQVTQSGPDLSRIPVAAGGTSGAYQPGQGPSLQMLMQAASNPWLTDSQKSIIGLMIKQKMAEQDPARALEMEYKRAQINKLTDPNARDKFGNSVIWGQDADGKWVAMQPSSGGGLVPAKTPEGISLSPPGIGQVNLGTSYGFRDRNGNIVNDVPIDNAGKAAASASGKAQGEAAFDLPRVEQNAQQTLDVLERMKTHPGREGSTGFIEGMLPSRTSDQVDFQSLADQTQGQSFLQAFQMLKGAGQITDIEGRKATEAISRLGNQRLSDADYLRAISDLEDVVRTGLARARVQAGQGGGPAPSSGGQKRLKFNPATGELE